MINVFNRKNKTIVRHVSFIEVLLIRYVRCLHSFPPEVIVCDAADVLSSFILGHRYTGRICILYLFTSQVREMLLMLCFNRYLEGVRCFRNYLEALDNVDVSSEFSLFLIETG